jgi:hypothetical protein
MKSQSPLNLRKVAAALCGVGLALGVVVHTAQADEWDKKTILTVDQPIQVKDRLLQPGTYVFKLLNSNADRHIVEIFNSDQSQIIDTVLAVPNYRLQPTGHSQFAFWETPPGNAKALRAWFYPGDNFGQEFPYPNHFIALNTGTVMSAQAAPTTTAPTTQEAAPATPPVETQPAQPQQQTEVEVERHEEIAQATPPPQPAPPPVTSEPAPAPSAERSVPENLPKTGSYYPLIGLCGLFSLALYGLVRLKRTA